MFRDGVLHMLSDRRAILAILGLVLSVCGLPSVVSGDESQKPAGKSADFRQQVADDVTKPLDAVRKRAPQAKTRLDAMAWFMTGKLLQSRNDLRGALKSYEKAIATDPDAIEVYRELVPLAFRLNLITNAVALVLIQRQVHDEALAWHFGSCAALIQARMLFRHPCNKGWFSLLLRNCDRFLQ